MPEISNLVVILAAGKASRISQLSFDRPKTLLSINGQSIVLRLCILLSRIASKIVIIGGQHALAIEEHLAGPFPNACVIADELAPDMGNTYSMMLGLKELIRSTERSFTIVEGDIILTQEAFSEFLEFQGENKFSVTSYGIQDSDDKVCTDRLTGKMTITKTPESKHIVLGKFIGLTTLSRSRALAVYEASKGKEDKPYVEVVQNFLDPNEEVVFIPDGQADEIDNAIDYQRVLFDSKLTMPLSTCLLAACRSRLSFAGPLKRLAGVYDYVGARLAQRAGFDGLWLGSFQIALSQGLRDDSSYDNLLALRVARELRSRGIITPLVVDGTSGGNNQSEARQLVADCLEQDVSALCIDDQGARRACSLLPNEPRDLLSIEDFQERIRSFAEFSGGQVQIIARTESLNIGRPDSEVADRLHAAIEAGASAIIPHYVEDEVGRIRAFLACHKFSRPIVLIPTRLLQVPLESFKEMGCAAIVYANIDLRLRFSTLLDVYARISSLGRIDEPEALLLFDPALLSESL